MAAFVLVEGRKNENTLVWQHKKGLTFIMGYDVAKALEHLGYKGDALWCCTEPIRWKGDVLKLDGHITLYQSGHMSNYSCVLSWNSKTAQLSVDSVKEEKPE